MTDTTTYKTEDGVELKTGDRAYNYYDMTVGTIGRDVDGDWFEFDLDTGGDTLLNGQRICTLEYAARRGFRGAQEALDARDAAENPLPRQVAIELKLDWSDVADLSNALNRAANENDRIKGAGPSVRNESVRFRAMAARIRELYETKAFAENNPLAW